MPLCKVEIWDEEGNVLPYGVEGEIAVNSLGNMQGYLDGGGLVEKNGESWVTSGDIGYLDEKGFLHIVDRKKRSLKIAAVNVFPARGKLRQKVEFCGRGVCRALHRQRQTVSESVCNAEHPTPLDVVKKRRGHLFGKPDTLFRATFQEVLDKMPRTDFGKIDYVSLEKR